MSVRSRLALAALLIGSLLGTASSVHAHPQRAPAPPLQRVGSFTIDGFAGTVEIARRDNQLLVYVLVGTDVRVGDQFVAGGRSVVVDEMQVWLLADEGTAVGVKQGPQRGAAGSACSGGCTANIIFVFRGGKTPRAVVLRWGNEFRVFPIAGT